MFSQAPQEADFFWRWKYFPQDPLIRIRNKLIICQIVDQWPLTFIWPLVNNSDVEWISTFKYCLNCAGIYTVLNLFIHWFFIGQILVMLEGSAFIPSEKFSNLKFLKNWEFEIGEVRNLATSGRNLSNLESLFERI